MGTVAVILKVMPDGLEVDLDSIQTQIKNKVDVKDMGLENVAFGLKAIKVALELPDAEGVLDENIDKINEIEGVQSVEVDKMDLI